MFDPKIFEDDIQKISNYFGQIYFRDTFGTVANVNQPVVGFDNRIMNELISEIWDIDLTSSYSAIKDTLFKDLIGGQVSAI